MKIILLAVVTLIIAFILWSPGSSAPAKLHNPPPTQQPDPVVTKPTVLTPPLLDAASRVTKKTFGMYILPKDSPVSPDETPC